MISLLTFLSWVGAMRSIAQTISYEVSMAIIIINIILFNMNYNLCSIQFNSYLLIPTFNFMILTFWFITLLAELNRAPFDLVEGESELVSGFNTEYSSVLFTLLFMAEYLNILMMSMLTIIISMSMLNSIIIMPSFMLSALSSLIILSRSSYPRIRYDILMQLNWMMLLPFILVLLMMNMNIN